MADVSSRLYNWSTNEASNAPLGTTTIGSGLDDNLRQIQATVRAELAKKGSDIASAATTDLGATAGSSHDITGTTTITAFGTVDSGLWKVLQFNSTCTVKYNASSLILPSQADITAQPTDCLMAYSLGSGNWRVPFFQRSAGTALVQGSVALSLLGISGGTQETALATGDSMPLYDTSAGANRRMLVSDVLRVVNSLTEDTSPSATLDYVMTYDASADAAKKVKWISFPKLLLSTPAASTSGTSIDYTGITSNATIIIIEFVGVSTNGTSNIIFQLGDSGGVETSGYSGFGAGFQNAGAVTVSTSTAGFPIVGSSAGNVYGGSILLTLENSSNNTWIANGNFGGANGGTALFFSVAGTKSTSATLDRIRITTANGTDAFDAGEVNVSYA